MERILFLFMMFSIVGYLWETPWVSFNEKKFVNRGFLHGPYIPIYGFAVMTIVLSMKIFDGVDNSGIWITLLQMIYMGSITALWEFFTSYGMEKIFHARWWDYSSHKFNIQGRVSLYVTIFFAIGGYTLWRFVLPPFEWLYSEIPSTYMFVLLIVFYIGFLYDSYITTRDLFKIRDIMVTLENASKEMLEKVEGRVGDLKESIDVKKEKLLESVSHYRCELENWYDALDEESNTRKVMNELDRVKKLIDSRPRLNRFSLKYPYSYNKQIVMFKKTLLAVKNKVQRKKPTE